MKRSVTLWVVAVLVTLASVVWQRMTGPTYPLNVESTVGGLAVSGELLRTRTIDTTVPVELEAEAGITGEVQWRRWPSDAAWQTVPLVRDGDQLVGELPGQLAHQLVPITNQRHRLPRSIRRPAPPLHLARDPRLGLKFHGHRRIDGAGSQ